MESNKTSICVIGAGRAGLTHARNFVASVPHARLAALSDPEPNTLAKAGEELNVTALFPDYRQALERKDIDAVVVATPTALHRDIVVAAAEAGKHILCEKPMAMNPAECDAMNAAAAKHGVILQIGFMRRFDQGFLQARERIAQGEIGDVVMVKSHTHGPSIPKPWMYDIRASNGPLAEVNSHDIDTLRWFTGSEFATVFAFAGNYRCPQARAEFPDFYDNVILTARFRNGMQGFVGGAQGVQYGYDCRCEILGTRGLLTVGSLAAAPITVCTSNGLVTPVINSWQRLFADAYRAEDTDFVACIRASREPRVSGIDGKHAVEVVIAGNTSIQTGKPVELT
jgi:predicted dehydrogenase